MSKQSNPLFGVHSIMETPVLDERKWAKVPSQPTDGVLIDMEDTVAQSRKLEGRAAVVAALENRDYFGDRVLMSRPNALDTPWGYEDTVALARAGADTVLLPMVTSAADVRAYQRIFHDNGADPLLVPAIETPAGATNAEEIAAVDGVAALTFGEGDLTALMGIPIFEPDGTLNPMVVAARSRVYLAAAAYGRAMFDIPFLPDLHDLDALRTRAAQLARMGATGLFALYPPHVAVINDIYVPPAEEVAYARRVVEAFETAAAKGDPAVQLDKKAVLIHDYKKARSLLARSSHAVA